MLFRRRIKPSIRERIRVAIWPRRGWSRSLRYFGKRVRRMGGTPHVIALGIAAGAFAACLPYLGFQVVTAGIIAWMIRGSIGAAILGTFVANPITYPLIMVGSYRIGDAMLGGTGQIDPDKLHSGFQQTWTLIYNQSPDALAAAGAFLWPLLKPMSLGALPLGLIVAVFFYYSSRRMVEAYQNRRQLCLQGYLNG